MHKSIIRDESGQVEEGQSGLSKRHRQGSHYVMCQSVRRNIEEDEEEGEKEEGGREGRRREGGGGGEGGGEGEGGEGKTDEEAEEKTDEEAEKTDEKKRKVPIPASSKPRGPSSTMMILQGSREPFTGKLYLQSDPESLIRDSSPSSSV